MSTAKPGNTLGFVVRSQTDKCPRYFWLYSGIRNLLSFRGEQPGLYVAFLRRFSTHSFGEVRPSPQLSCFFLTQLMDAPTRQWYVKLLSASKLLQIGPGEFKAFHLQAITTIPQQHIKRKMITALAEERAKSQRSGEAKKRKTLKIYSHLEPMCVFPPLTSKKDLR